MSRPQIVCVDCGALVESDRPGSAGDPPRCWGCYVPPPRAVLEEQFRQVQACAACGRRAPLVDGECPDWIAGTDGLGLGSRKWSPHSLETPRRHFVPKRELRWKLLAGALALAAAAALSGCKKSPFGLDEGTVGAVGLDGGTVGVLQGDL